MIKCKLDIKKAVIKTAIKAGETNYKVKQFSDNSLKVSDIDFSTNAESFKVAEAIKNDLNNRFGDNIANRIKVTGGHEIMILPSQALVDDYYDGYIKTQGIIEKAETGVDRFGDSAPLANIGAEGDFKNDIRARLFNGTQTTTSKSVLNKISKSNHSLNKLAAHLKDFIEHNNVTIILKPVSDFDMNKLPGGKAAGVSAEDNKASAYYDPNTNAIHIAEFAYHEGGVEGSILHEIIHSITFKELRSESESSRDFNKLYEYTREKLGYKYALANKDEFIVALFTNEKFVNELKNIEASKNHKTYKNLFQEIFDHILKLIGIGRTNSLYEQAFANASHVLTDFKDRNDSIVNSMGMDEYYSPVGSKAATKAAFSIQHQYIGNQIKRMQKELDGMSSTNPKYAAKKIDLDKAKEKFKALETNPTEESYETLGREFLIDAMNDLSNIESGNVTDVTDKWLNSISSVINVWEKFPGLETETARVKRRLNNILTNNIVKKVNEFSNEKTAITLETIDSQDKDVSWWTHGTGSLADLGNYIAKTIGLQIKSSQNKIAVKNNEDRKVIQEEVELLNEYAKKNGVDLDSIWDTFITIKDGTTELVSEYNSDGDIDKNWEKIQATPELKRFYDFYQTKMEEKLDQVPFVKGGKFFIPNISNSDVKSWIKSKSPLKKRVVGEGYEEDMSLDLVPLKYNAAMDPRDKNKNLAYALLQYSMHTNEHAGMSEILPGLRLMQEHLKYNAEDPSKQKQFKSAVNPNSKINAEDTNLWKMIDKIIEMQVLGKMKAEEGKFVYGNTIDKDGGIVESYVDLRQAGDDVLKYNSLLRIGFSPIGAAANILFGDISNTIEAVGGRFMTYKGLLQASKIFANQAFNKDSVLNKLHEELNFLQELDDYAYLEKVRLTGKKAGISGEKLQEYAYGMQKAGENWIQSRIALAIMIKDDYIDSNGELTDRYKNATEKEKQQLTDKIQRINHMNHGRYTTKEAAVWQQNILFRAISQFRKYIPAAIENRIGEYNPHDTRLGVDTEGRYRTFAREVLKEGLTNPRQALQNLLLPIMNMQKAIKEGKLTEMEVYNMRKMMVEIILAATSVLLYAGLKSGDDEDKKKRMRNPFVKVSMTLLNRISGDLTYFMNPANATTLTSNVLPVNKLLKDLGNTINYGVRGYPFYAGDWEIKHGSMKGRNKFYKTVAGEVPFSKSIQDLWRMANQEALEELNK